MDLLHPAIKDWQNKGSYYKTKLNNFNVFYQDRGNKFADADNTLIIIHGFPESSFSFHKVIDGLSKQFDRILLFDFIGFGLSDKPDNYSYSIFDHANLVLEISAFLNIKGAHLISHDMGTTVTAELVTRALLGELPIHFNEGIRSVTFTNGSMLVDFAKLRITQKILLSKYGHLLSKVVSYSLLKHQVKSAHGNDNLNEDDYKFLWINLKYNDGHFKNHLLMQYYKDRMRFEKSRWIPALKKTNIPIHICWADQDQVAQLIIAENLKANVCTEAKLSIMKNTGHFCQIGNPDEWLKNIIKFYSTANKQ